VLSAFEICKAAYPGIPDQIFLEYADLLPAEASALSAEFAATDIKFFKVWQTIRTSFSFGFVSIPFWFDQRIARMSTAINFLQPQNNNEKVNSTLTVNFTATETVNRISVSPGVVDTGPNYNAAGALNFTFDRRLFANPTFVLGRVMFSAIAINTNPNAQAFGQYVARTTAAGSAAIQKKPYAGAETIYALYENGVTIADVDYARLSAFVTYINAYKKFSTQIDAEKSLLTNQAAASLAAYQQDFRDRADREKTELQSKKLQIFIAIDNEAKSAQRDFQNMLINAQNLRNTLGGSLG